jgi:hypothetical protein
MAASKIDLNTSPQADCHDTLNLCYTAMGSLLGKILKKNFLEPRTQGPESLTNIEVRASFARWIRLKAQSQSVSH